MTTSSDRIAELTDRAKHAQQQVQSALAQDQQQLSAAVDQAMQESARRAEQLQREAARRKAAASASMEEARNKWQEHVASAKSGIQNRKAERDANRAERNAAGPAPPGRPLPPSHGREPYWPRRRAPTCAASRG